MNKNDVISLFPDAPQTTTKEKAPNTQKEKEKKPHYHGHRDRLRARFVENGAESLQDYELIELILFMAIPRKDVKPLAKNLLDIFQGLPGLMNADMTELTRINGISDNTAIALKAITETAHRSMKRDMMGKPILNTWSRLIEYCHATMGHEKNEQFRVLFLNKKNELIADEIQGRGTVDHTPAYPREIVKRALELGATALILAHNHPSGDPSPSQADVLMTGEIIRAAEPLGIEVHDHLIISRTKHSSFKTLGLI